MSDQVEITPIHYAVAVLSFNMECERAKDLPYVAKYAVVKLRGFTDLCWWNDRAWQYITTQRLTT
jgi:hypothetical protein